MGKLLKASVLVFLVFIAFLFLSRSVKAQGSVHCYDTGTYCALDGLVVPNPDCSPNFLPPDCALGGAEGCCTSQNRIDCKNVPCIIDTPIPLCGSGLTCTSVDIPACVANGGNNQSCLKPNGTEGTCCQPDTGPGNDQDCPAGFPSCISGSLATCAYYSGVEISCVDSNSQAGNCCIPHTPCPSGDICEWVSSLGNTCSINGGNPQECIIKDTGVIGNCCKPGEQTYQCKYTSGTSICETDFTFGIYNCTGNWGYCSISDTNCTSCDNVCDGLDPAACEAACLGLNPRACIEQNPSIGYYCAGPTFGCYPCFDYMADPNNKSFYKPECDPPQYRGGTPEENVGNCQQACLGIVPIKWACNPGFGCVESQYGYKDAGVCNATCNDLSFLPFFCVGNTDPSNMTSDAGSQRIATGIGCIPVADNIEFGKFFIGWALGIGGGVAFLMMIISGFMIMTSAGDPKKLAAGKELLTAAIAGLVFLVLGVFILRVIGVDVLGIIL